MVITLLSRAGSTSRLRWKTSFSHCSMLPATWVAFCHCSRICGLSPSLRLRTTRNATRSLLMTSIWVATRAGGVTPP